MENYAITKLEDRVAELENELRRFKFGSEQLRIESERLRSDAERLQVELRRVEIESRPKPAILGDGFFTNAVMGVGCAAIGGGVGLIFVGLVNFLFKA